MYEMWVITVDIEKQHWR